MKNFINCQNFFPNHQGFPSLIDLVNKKKEILLTFDLDNLITTSISGLHHTKNDVIELFEGYIINYDNYKALNTNIPLLTILTNKRPQNTTINIEYDAAFSDWLKPYFNQQLYTATYTFLNQEKKEIADEQYLFLLYDMFELDYTKECNEKINILLEMYVEAKKDKYLSTNSRIELDKKIYKEWNNNYHFFITQLCQSSLITLKYEELINEVTQYILTLKRKFDIALNRNHLETLLFLQQYLLFKDPFTFENSKSTIKELEYYLNSLQKGSVSLIFIILVFICTVFIMVARSYGLYRNEVLFVQNLKHNYNEQTETLSISFSTSSKNFSETPFIKPFYKEIAKYFPQKDSFELICIVNDSLYFNRQIKYFKDGSFDIMPTKADKTYFSGKVTLKSRIENKQAISGSVVKFVPAKQYNGVDIVDYPFNLEMKNNKYLLNYTDENKKYITLPFETQLYKYNNLESTKYRAIDLISNIFELDNSTISLKEFEYANGYTNDKYCFSILPNPQKNTFAVEIFYFIKPSFNNTIKKRKGYYIFTKTNPAQFLEYKEFLIPDILALNGFKTDYAKLIVK